MNESGREKVALGERLAEARDLAGLSQPAVAILLTNAGVQCTKQAVSAWEKGRNVPDAFVIGHLARLYDTSADALLGRRTMSAEAERLAAVFDSMLPDAQADFMTVCSPFLQKHARGIEAELFALQEQEQPQATRRAVTTRIA